MMTGCCDGHALVSSAEGHITQSCYGPPYRGHGQRINEMTCPGALQQPSTQTWNFGTAVLTSAVSRRKSEAQTAPNASRL